jgi:hypothetical protein
VSTKQLPPFPNRDLNLWAKQLYEYLIAQSPVRGSVEPTPILLPHITDGQLPRAVTDGVLLYNPTTEQAVISIDNAWEPLGPTVLPPPYELPDVNSNVGTFGTTTAVPQVTVDAKGRITAVSDLGIAFPPAPPVAATDLTDLTGVPVDFLAGDGAFRPIKYFARNIAAYTLTSTTAAQKLLTVGTDGALTLPVGIYEYTCVLDITAMSATSGNARFSLQGTAVAAAHKGVAIAADASATPAAANIFVTAGAISGSGFLITTATTGTALYAYLTGTFSVTTAGTIIPSIGLVTAAAAEVGTRTYFTCQPLNNTTTNSRGPWS